MSSVESVAEAVRGILTPYVRTREEAAYVRRVLSLHVDSCLKDAPVVQPLALVEASGASIPPEARGLRREYLEALNANIKARAEYDSVARVHSHPTASAAFATETKPDYLEEHLRTIRLEKKHQKLSTILKYIDLLTQKPAARSEFLDPGEIFKDSSPLPEVPVEVVNGLTRDITAPKTDLEDLVSQLEKQVLRAKLLLSQEERLLQDVKARSSFNAENVSDSKKLGALNITRNELISWIEAELAQAGDDAEESVDGENRRPQAAAIAGCMDKRLESIKEKYSAYIAARKSLLQLVSEQPCPTVEPPVKDMKQATAPTSAAAPSLHLFTPYLWRMLEVSQEQKALITQKSHLNITIAKQLKENCQILDHVAEESQLLPSHPVPGAGRRNLGFGDSLAPSENLDSSTRVKPWVYAADSAKIATLEIVAEKIDEGQMALESTLKTLEEIDRLLNKAPNHQDRVDESSQADDDIWLDDGTPVGKEIITRKHIGRPAAQKGSSDIWDTLDGSLGLLRTETDPL